VTSKYGHVVSGQVENAICSSSGSYTFLSEVQTTIIWSGQILLSL